VFIIWPPNELDLSRQTWVIVEVRAEYDSNGILKVAALVGCGSGTVQRLKREVLGKLVTALGS
jgi:hypothetical protein